MQNEWDQVIADLSGIKVFSNPNNEPVTIKGEVKGIRCIGIGTDAAVFQSLAAPQYAFKAYAKDRLEKVKIEESVYRKLDGASFFPTCFASYDRYLVLSYEEGITLFDCIVQGIHIPEVVIDEVENAREFVRSKGLNPRDIHLKNILLQDGRAKIIDVSEYVLEGDDLRWHYLKKGYEQYYHLIDGVPIPLWLVEIVRKRYNQQAQNTFSYENFTKSLLKLFHKKNDS